MTTPDGQTINYTYDAAGRLAQIIPNGGQPFGFTYDAGGRRTALAYPNGVTASYTYDTQNNLTGLVYNTSTSATIDSFSYTYDNEGNRLTKSDINYQYGYAYDAGYEVTQCLATQVAQSPTFQQYTENFTFDSVGNRLTGTGYAKPTGYGQNYFYDYENRLVKVVNQLGSTVDTITFKYDPFGRRIEKNVDTVENNLPTTYDYVYVYDNADIILEILNKTQNGTTTTITTSYVHGPGIDEHLSLTRDGQTYYYHADGLGSVTSMTDATQAVVNRYAYDTYGVMKRSETVWNDYGFAGREYDSETGLYYLRARYYDPETGKFMSKDPIGFNGGDVNLYRYVGNNPMNWLDPFGLKEFEMTIWVGGSVGYTIVGAGVYDVTIRDLETGKTTLYTVKAFGLGVGLPSFRGSSRPIKFKADDCMTSESFNGNGYMGGASFEAYGIGVKGGGGIQIPNGPFIPGNMIDWDRGGFDIGVSHNWTYWSH